MCLIVDANRASAVFSQPKDPDSAPIWNWLQRGGCLVYGGLLAKELGRVKATRLLQQLRLAGRAYEAPRMDVDAEMAVVGALDKKSNDPHVLALARVTGARVLHTLDGKLMDDFRDPLLVPRPRGKIYQRHEHARLLTHCKGCRGPSARRGRHS